jgi:hypothetical protein
VSARQGSRRSKPLVKTLNANRVYGSLPLHLEYPLRRHLAPRQAAPLIREQCFTVPGRHLLRNLIPWELAF